KNNNKKTSSQANLPPPERFGAGAGSVAGSQRGVVPQCLLLKKFKDWLALLPRYKILKTNRCSIGGWERVL
ncbi:MAG: hypothetical protein AAF184_16240, partial [Pseudomonadota bacterium]